MDSGDGVLHIVPIYGASRSRCLSLRGNVRSRGKLVGQRHHVRSQDRVRLPTESRSTKRPLRTAISDASPSPRRISNTSSGKTPCAKVFGEDWRMCLVFSPVLSSRPCSRRSACPPCTCDPGRLVSALRDARRASRWTLEPVCRTLFLHARLRIASSRPSFEFG